MLRLIRWLIIPIVCVCGLPLSGQSLFTSTISEKEGIGGGILDIGGFIRGTLYTGWNSEDEAEIKTSYAESALKLSAKPNQWGKAYADIRFRTGYFDGEPSSQFDLREAYVDLYLKKFDFRFGKQIKVWGRADAFNPTQNLTPYDYFLRSPDIDDSRLGNLVMTGRYHPTSFLHLEIDWVPFYRPSIYRFDLLDMPEMVDFTEGQYPDARMKNGSLGFKADLILNKLEGSISYFSGYDAMPGLAIGNLPTPPFENFVISLTPSAYKQSTIGADFAINLGEFGIRAEIAREKPEEDINNPALPMEEISWVLGIDRSFGSFRILAEYYGKKIQDFEHLDPPIDYNPAILQDPSIWPHLGSMVADQIKYYNRILFSQTHEWIHSLLFRPSVSLFHESLDIEFTGLYNFTTKEYMLRPMLSYEIADGIECKAGYEHYYGPDNTSFDWITGIFNGPFAEIRISF